MRRMKPSWFSSERPQAVFRRRRPRSTQTPNSPNTAPDAPTAENGPGVKNWAATPPIPAAATYRARKGADPTERSIRGPRAYRAHMLNRM